MVTYDWSDRYRRFNPAELERMWEEQTMYPKDALRLEECLIQGVTMDL